MAKKDHYSYPDKNDALTVQFIETKQPFEGYWEKSEKFVLEQMKKIIKTYARNKIDTYFMDAGCGTGRLLPEFESYFDKIVAIDPDEDSLKIAKEKVEKFGISRKMIFQNSTIENIDWKNGSVDVILCSHVLQHVHTEIVPNILTKFQKILKINGLVFILTSQSIDNFDFFTKMYLENREVSEERIEKNEFNSLILNENNILPIHFFSRKNFLQMLRSYQFELIDSKSFHILNRIPFLDHIVFRDKLINFFSFLQTRFGRDIFIACRRC